MVRHMPIRISVDTRIKSVLYSMKLQITHKLLCAIACIMDNSCFVRVKSLIAAQLEAIVLTWVWTKVLNFMAKALFILRNCTFSDDIVQNLWLFDLFGFYISFYLYVSMSMQLIEFFIQFEIKYNVYAKYVRRA